MSKNDVIERALEENIIESILDKKGVYRVKKGCSIPITEKSIVWKRFWYTSTVDDYILPENSLLLCKTEYCNPVYFSDTRCKEGPRFIPGFLRNDSVFMYLYCFSYMKKYQSSARNYIPGLRIMSYKHCDSSSD